LNSTRKHFQIKRHFVFGACIALFLLALGFAVRLISIEAALTASSMDLYTDSAYQKDLLLENFPVYKQAYANSCGPTTISMIYSYLIEPISEQGLADKLGFSLGQSGMLPAQFYHRLNAALEENGFRVKHQVNISDATFLERTSAQLQQGIPVPIYFSTINAWDKPNYDTHYSVIIGIRPEKREVVIANAYGFLEEMPISDLLNAIKFRNFYHAPLDFRAGLFVGFINKNNLFAIQK
jgi:hypothetical protein